VTDTWKEPPPCEDAAQDPPSEGAGCASGKAQDDLRAKLVERAFKVNVKPVKPAPVLQFLGHPIGTPGNIVVVQAAPKAGKTGVVGAILSACINGNLQTGADTLGFFADNRDNKAVLHFDTEQSRFDHDCLVRTGLSRCKVETPPSWFYSWSLADLTTAERRAALELAMGDASALHHGVLCVLIDGIADLMHEPNDSKESNEIVDWIRTLTITHDCCIILVLHENPGSDVGKTRGHLGSQLARKAEASLRLAKDAAGVTTMWVPHARHGEIPQSQGVCFAWSLSAGMHVTLGKAGDLRGAAEQEKHAGEAERVYQDARTLSYSDLVSRICEVCAIKERAAKNRVAKWAELGVVRKEPSGSYRITPIKS